MRGLFGRFNKFKSGKCISISCLFLIKQLVKATEIKSSEFHDS